MRKRSHLLWGFSFGMILSTIIWMEVAGANDFPFKEKGNGVSFYGKLIERLVDEGFNKRRPREIFSDSKVLFQKEVLDRNIVFRESKADYSSFLLPRSVKRARKFMVKYRSFLKKLEIKYGAPREVIVAILLVESSLGRLQGRYGLVSVFSSLSMLDWPEVAKPCEVWLKGQYSHMTDSYLKKRIKAKSKWAFKELVYLFRLEEKAKVVDVLKMKGSWAGAFGICQFLPSSMYRYGVDGDGDGKIKLQEPYDGMASVANYLKGTGWKEDISEKEKKKVILKYNYSNLYVQTILKIAEGLKKGT